MLLNPSFLGERWRERLAVGVRSGPFITHVARRNNSDVVDDTIRAIADPPGRVDRAQETCGVRIDKGTIGGPFRRRTKARGSPHRQPPPKISIALTLRCLDGTRYSNTAWQSWGRGAGEWVELLSCAFDSGTLQHMEL